MDSSANSTHFVKIFLSDDVDSHTKLMIPRKFVMKYGDNLHTRMYLKTPNGLVWAVDLQRHKDDVWLHNGWDEFVKFYSLQFGNMLVFEYSGDSNFHVLIFDWSSSEIDYPLMTSNANNISFGKTTQVRKRVNNEVDEASTSSDSVRPFKKNMPKFETKVDVLDRVSLKPKSQQKKSKGHCSESATKEAIIRAQAFQSSNPFFVVRMKPTHVGGTGCRMAISKAFEETYNKWKDKDQVTLQVDGKTWLVTCDHQWNMYCRLRLGWPKFAQQNSLNVGDVCVFELINSCEKLLRVFIYRAEKYTNCEGQKGKLVARSEAEVVLALANAFESKNPFIKIKLHWSAVNAGSLSWPLNFIKRCMLSKDHFNVILQVSNGRSWSVKCHVYHTVAKLSGGWPQFAGENNLVAGDICVFELINVSENLFNVVIFRAKSSVCW